MSQSDFFEFFRRNSTLVIVQSLNRKGSLSLGAIPEQDGNYLCVPEGSSPTIRLTNPIEFTCPDPENSLRKIETSTSLSIPSDFKFSDVRINVYRIRWTLLALCMAYTALSFAQWIQISIIANIVIEYYGVSSIAIDWTSMVFMITYIILVFPITYLTEYKSLREVSIVGSVNLIFGCWIKTFAIQRTGFPILIFGQFVIAISQIFILNVPPKLTSTWFAPDEISTVCGSAVFAAQLGIAIGFFTTPWFIRHHETEIEIKAGLQALFFANAGLATLFGCLVIILFKSEPKYPPSHVEAIARSSEMTSLGYWDALRTIVFNKTFVNIICIYGVNSGVLNALSTLLNQIILFYFPDSEQLAGNIGVAIILMGLLGSLIFGFIMDTTRRYKTTAIWVSGLSAIGMLLFYLAMESKSTILLYVSSIILGFFLTGYQTVGVELATELSFPQPELLVNALLNISGHIFGLIITTIQAQIEDYFGAIVQHMIFILWLILGTILIYKVPFESKRTLIHDEVAAEAEQLADVERANGVVFHIEEF